jgi:hypothetical protein
MEKTMAGEAFDTHGFRPGDRVLFTFFDRASGEVVRRSGTLVGRAGKSKVCCQVKDADGKLHVDRYDNLHRAKKRIRKPKKPKKPKKPQKVVKRIGKRPGKKRIIRPKKTT